MASEWKECTLAELGEIVGGATPSTKDESNYGGDIAWITPKDLSALKGRFIAHGERNITEKGLYSCSTQMMPANAVLFSSRAPIGYVAIAKNPVCTNQGFKSIVANADNDPMFLYYLLKYNKDAIEAMGSGTTFKEVSGSTMRGIRVRVPVSKAEQQRIASVLAAIDSKIENNGKINDNLEQQAIALYKSWFVDFAPFGGAMPIGWNISSLGESTEMGAGGDKPKLTSPIKTEECPYPIFSNGLSDYGLYGYTNEAKIHAESVTVSARGTIGFVCLRHIPYVPIVRLVTLIPKRELMSAKYLYLYLRQLNISGTGTTQQQLTVPDFRKTEIVIPDKETMTAFTALITPMFEKMWANEEENDSLAKIRDALLPKLMSGEVDVSSIQI